MSLKTERVIDKVVSNLNRQKWQKLTNYGRKALLTTVSTISLTVGMLGTPTQAHAQAPQKYVTVNVKDLDAYLNGNRDVASAQTSQQRGYERVYANRDAYRAQRQQNYEYGSAEWLEAHHYEYSPRYSNRNLNRRDWLGAYLDYSQTDRYGRPTHVVYLPRNPLGRIHRTSVDDAEQMRKHPGGDTLGIYSSPNGTDINNPENNAPWGYPVGGHHHGSRAERIADAAAHVIFHTIGHHR